MLAAYEPVCFDLASLDGRVLLAPSLDKKTHDWARDCARAHGVPVVDVEPGGSAMSVLSAFDVTLTSPGSAALESALAGAVPIMVHRGTFPADLKDLAPRRKKTMGLPNRLLQRDVFPELGPSEANATRIGDTLVRVLRAKHRYAADCVAVDRSLGSKKQPSEAVAAMLLPWLGANAALRAS
jgi:lipid A disaccharide synthetase